MEPQTLVNIAVGLAVIVWIGGRQLAWRPLAQRSLWTVPLILTVAGLVLMIGQVKPAAFTSLALGVLAIEVALSLAIGVVMGRIARFRRDEASGWQTRTGWLGLVLWVALIGLRIGMDIWAEGAGAGELLVSTGTILLVVGVNRLTRSAVLAYRASRHQLVAA